MGLKDRVEAAERTQLPDGPDPQWVPPTPEQNGQAVAELAESDIEANLDVPVHVAWTRVQAEVEYVKKGTSKGLNYEFRGIDAVLNVVGPAVRKHGISVMPARVRPEYTVVTAKSGAVMNYCRAVVSYIIMGPRGDMLSAPNDAGTVVPLMFESLGEAFDTGDKASTKAQSVALREFYIKALAIPTNQPERDTENGPQHELAGPPRPTPAQYHAEIIDERTTIPRLQQIRDELAGDQSLANAVVKGLDDEEIELWRLVRRVGAARLAKQKTTEGGGA